MLCVRRADDGGRALERADGQMAVETAGTVDEALTRLEEGVDCVVAAGAGSDEGVVGAVREAHPAVPVVTFGDWTTPSEAFAAGAADHVPAAGAEPYVRLARAVRNAVERSDGAAVDGTVDRPLETEYDRLIDLVEYLPTSVVYGEMTGEGPVIRRVNAAFEETFGYDRGAVLGENLDDVIVPPEQQESAAAINDRLQAGESVRTEVERRTADGMREFLMRAVIQEETEEWYAIYTDITERRRRKRELERQNERLESFVSVVSHDLRSPLAVAKGNVELAREERDGQLLANAAEALDRMSALIDDLLTLAREGERVNDLESVALRPVAESCWNGVETADATLRIETDRTVCADRSRVKQLVSNLYRNAVEHGGADVTVTVGDLEDGFYVADDGPGIPESERGRIFESGFTTSDEGTGFGLSIVEEIAEAHGWTVAATESADGGARFEITGVEVVDDEDAGE